MDMKRASFHTLGCKLNYTETATFREQFEHAGFEAVDFGDEADVVLINTCSVTSKADAEARKVVRQALRRSPGAYVVVVGCYAQLRPDEIASIDGVDLVLGAQEKFHILEHVDPALEKGIPRIIAGEVEEATSFEASFAADAGDRTRAFLKVQDGCDYNCSYCTIPMARGTSRSESIEKTLVHAREIVSRGFREIVLSGVNVGDYGAGTETGLYQLLLAMHEIDGDFRIRISSIEPNLLTDEIIALTAASDRMCRHSPIPLQAGSDPVLRFMRRRYNTSLFRDRIDRIHSEVPDCGIGIDVITGSPGETREYFEEGYRFLVDLRFSYLHVFAYSERPGTDAVRLGGPVAPADRAERSRMLRGLSAKKRRAFYETQIGKTLPVLFEKEDAHGLIGGFSDNYVRVAVPHNPRLENTLQSVLAENIEGEHVHGVLAEGSAAVPGYLALPVADSVGRVSGVPGT